MRTCVGKNVVRALPVLLVGICFWVAAPALAAPCTVPLSVPFDSQLSVAAAAPNCPQYPELPPEPEYHASVFAGQSVPSTMVVGQRYNVNVSMQNTGSLVWTAGQNVNLGSQNPGDNTTWGLHRVPTPSAVSEGQVASFNFTVTAPRTAGRYNFQWRMVQDGVTWFGRSSTNVQVNVVSSTIRGNVEGITNGQITGWACSSGINDPIDVHLYLGGAAGASGAVMVGGYRANHASEPGVASACGAAGNTYRFYIPIDGAWTVNHANRPIHIHGISPVGAVNLAIPGSGNHRIPANAAPSISMTAPGNGTVVGEGGAVLLAAQASDPDDGVAGVTFLADGNTLGSSGAPFQWTYGNIPEGAHTVQAYARDTRGAVAYAQARTVYGSRVIGDTGLANGTIFGWACSTYVAGSIPVHLYLGGAAGTGVGYGAYTANLASEPGVNNQCKAGGTAYRFSIPITDAMVREHGGKRVYLHGISPVGGGNNLLANAGAYSVPVNQAPSITLTSPGNIQLESPGQVTISANASDPDDSVAQVAFFRNGQQVAVAVSAPWQHTVTGLVAGSYRFHAVATDRRGATATSASATVTVVQAQSPSGVTRSYVYDAFHRLCKTIEPETGATVVEYDAAGNVAWTASGLELPSTTACNRQEAAASGRRVDRGYDARNRVTSVRFPDRNGNQDLVYRYTGELSQVTTWNVQGAETTVNTFQYNKRNLLVAESVTTTGRPAWSLGYGYDPQGALARVLYPSGLAVTYTNTAQGRPLSVSAGGASYASAVRYHPNGSVKSFAYGNGIAHSTSLTARQLPYEQVDSGAAGHRYHYDGNANVVGIADMQQGAAYDRTLQYDGNHRLRAAGSASFGGDHWHRYTYDGRDNLISAALGGVKDHRYWYDARNRLTNVLDGSGATITGLTYDVQGNLRAKNGRVHIFDVGNRLREIQGIETYQYDAAGRRAVTSDASGDRLRSMYARNGQLAFEQRRGKGNVEYVQLGSRLLATREAGVVSYQHLDALGSQVAVSNAAGQVTGRTVYEPYGQSVGKTMDGVGFTGHVADAASGLVYMQQRYYDPEIGRFLSTDPVTATSDPVVMFNRYKYAANNPYSFRDPDGRQECRSCEISHGVGVALAIGDDKEKMRVWARGEAAAGVAGSGAEEGAALGQAIRDFVKTGDVSDQSVKTLATVVVIGVITRGKSVTAGGGGKISAIKPNELRRIQNAANRSGETITLVGSRASGKTHAGSDWDYVVNGNSKTRNNLSRSLPGSGNIKEGERSLVDMFRGEVDKSRPYIEVRPER